jgi:hypothetical protein
MSDVISIATYRSTADAWIAKAILNEVGIDSMIDAGKPGGMYPTELLVRLEDVHEAGEALHRRHRLPASLTLRTQRTLAETDL